MTRIIAALLVSAAAPPAAAADRSYPLTDFDRIVVEGPFQVSLATGKPTAATASGDPRAIDRVSLDVQGRTLRVRANRSAWGGYPGEAGGTVRIALATRDLRGATVTGSGALAIDKVKTMRFEAALSGSGRIGVGALEADTLVLGAIGGGRLSLAGNAKILRATIRGSADLDAAALRAETAEVQTDSSGTIAFAAARAVTLNASGTGDVTISGNAACTVNQTGAGLVRCGK